MSKYYDGMGNDITLTTRDAFNQLKETLNENTYLKTDIVEYKENLEKRATTIRKLRRKIKEQEETICQLRKKTPLIGEETPSEPQESET